MSGRDFAHVAAESINARAAILSRLAVDGHRITTDPSRPNSRETDLKSTARI